VTRLTPQARDALLRYPWPGNVRELRNVLFQALVNKRAGDELLLSDLPSTSCGAPRESRGATTLIDRAAIARLLDEGRMNLRAARDELERTALELALARSAGSPARAARLLGEVGRGASSDPGGRCARCCGATASSARSSATDPRRRPSPRASAAARVEAVARRAAA